MDIADRAEGYIEAEREFSVRQALDAMLPECPQVVVAGDDGAPLIICYDCEEPIQVERLRANPHAVRCIDCQIEYERIEAAEARAYG